MKGFETSAPCIPSHDSEAALRAARAIVGSSIHLGVDPHTLQGVYKKPNADGGASSWVFLDCGPQGDQDPTIAVKVEPDLTGKLTTERQQDVETFCRINNRLAQPRVEKHLVGPQFYPWEPLGAQHNSVPETAGYVSMVTAFLPGAYLKKYNSATDRYVSTNSAEVGRALADLHGVDTDDLGLSLYDPLKPTGSVVHTFRELHDRDQLPEHGADIRFDGRDLARLEALYACGVDSWQELCTLYEQQGWLLSYLHPDFTVNNVRFDKDGNACFIDLTNIDDSGQHKGPGLYNFCRVRDWGLFGRPQSVIDQMMQGYQAQRGTPFNEVDNQALELGRRVGRARYATTLMPRLAIASQLPASDRPANYPYFLTEAKNRLDPDAQSWHSEADYLNGKTIN